MTAVVGCQPSRLNEDPRRYGVLKEEDRMDLNKGCDSFKDEGYGDLFYSFFDYIKKTSKQGTPLKQAIGSDFISTRRNLITFAESVYSRSSFEIRALRKNGVIFLCDKKSEADSAHNYGGGYKFEQYMTLNDNGEPHDEFEPVSNAECSRAVLRTSFKSGDEEIKVFYGAEMDAQDTEGKYVEFKSTGQNDGKWLRNSSLKHYLQSYLGDVSYIVKGQTTADRVVFKVDKIITKDIPGMNGIKWDPERCIEKLFKVLQQIKNRLVNDDQAITVIVRGPNIYYKLDNAENCKFVDQSFLRYFE